MSDGRVSKLSQLPLQDLMTVGSAAAHLGGRYLIIGVRGRPGIIRDGPVSQTNVPLGCRSEARYRHLMLQVFLLESVPLQHRSCEECRNQNT